MKSTYRFVLVFAVACAASVLIHEIGHAVGGWVQGIPIVPTPAKAYALREQVSWRQQTWISLGGVVATAFLAAATIVWYARARRAVADAILAGVLLPLFAYSARFVIAGRGHDGLEWQEAQSAVGASLSGHAVDLLFLGLLLAGTGVWLVRRLSSLRAASLIKVVGLMLAGFTLLVILQTFNNVVFDPLFPDSRTIDVPPDADPK